LDCNRQTKRATHNSGLAKGGLTCFVETFVVIQTFVLRMNFCAKNPALPQAANRWPKYSAALNAKRKSRANENII